MAWIDRQDKICEEVDSDSERKPLLDAETRAKISATTKKAVDDIKDVIQELRAAPTKESKSKPESKPKKLMPFDD